MTEVGPSFWLTGDELARQRYDPQQTSDIATADDEALPVARLAGLNMLARSARLLKIYRNASRRRLWPPGVRPSPATTAPLVDHAPLGRFPAETEQPDEPAVTKRGGGAADLPHAAATAGTAEAARRLPGDTPSPRPSISEPTRAEAGPMGDRSVPPAGARPPAAAYLPRFLSLRVVSASIAPTVGQPRLDPRGRQGPAGLVATDTLTARQFEGARKLAALRRSISAVVDGPSRTAMAPLGGLRPPGAGPSGQPPPAHDWLDAALRARGLPCTVGELNGMVAGLSRRAAAQAVEQAI